MRGLIATMIVIVGGFSGCVCHPGDEPDAPYGRADDVSRFSASGGYESITYTYYCHDGKYISVDYIREDGCSDYYKDSEYISSGICGYSKLRQTVSGLAVEKRLPYLADMGYRIDTILHSCR